MAKTSEQKYPVVFENSDGRVLVARDEVQAAAAKKQGLSVSKNQNVKLPKQEVAGSEVNELKAQLAEAKAALQAAAESKKENKDDKQNQKEEK